MTKPQLGPVTPEEAALLTALTRMVAASVVVEFGYGRGASAAAFLEGLPPSGLLVSFDPAGGRVQNDDRHRLLTVSMVDFTPTLVGRPVDLLFFDADHVLSTSQTAWERAAGALAPDALVVVHDTGFWPVDLWPDAPDLGVVDNGRRWHRPDEVEFVAWLRGRGFEGVDLCSSRELRMGLTILRRAA
jgi:predicted O-methyltransferase YrrM